MEKATIENTVLRKALIMTQDDEEEAAEPEAVQGTGAPVMLESFLITLQKPPAASPSGRKTAGRPDWAQLPADPVGFA